MQCEEAVNKDFVAVSPRPRKDNVSIVSYNTQHQFCANTLKSFLQLAIPLNVTPAFSTLLGNYILYNYVIYTYVKAYIVESRYLVGEEKLSTNHLTVYNSQKTAPREIVFPKTYKIINLFFYASTENPLYIQVFKKYFIKKILPYLHSPVSRLPC